MLCAAFEALAAAGVARSVLVAASAEAERSGADPFDVLMTSGAIDGDVLAAATAAALGLEVLGDAHLAGPSIDADAFGVAMRSGRLQIDDAYGRRMHVIAARGEAIGQLWGRGPFSNDLKVLASPRAFADLAVARAGDRLAARAAEGPSARFPELTVASGMPRVGPVARCLMVCASAGLAVATLMSSLVSTALFLFAGLLFAFLNSFRLWIACTPPEEARDRIAPAVTNLPVYTVLVGLAREAAVVPSLLASLEALDYPAAKLDIKILVEEGDDETLGALAARPPRAGVEVLVLPPGGPKTKPRALNAGLLAARGSFLTVFDAEDRPEPQQLRMAVAAFRAAAGNVACVQARLAIDNLGDGWLARHFAIEYAALFDVTLPALAALDMPIPLGGTSNHFRVGALRAVGGWDPGNVTEDADLGLRLARLGWRTKTIDSTTWEEATTSVWPWMKQRTRWMKGFMVTAVVHGRRPGDLARKLDPLSFVASQLLIGGVALTALAYPLLLVAITWQAIDGSLLAPAESLAGAALTGFHIANMIVGFSAGLACAWMGVDRRRPGRLARHLVTMPFYWLLVGCAAWRALLQIVFDQTTRWEKTEHGVSRRRATPGQM